MSAPYEPVRLPLASLDYGRFIGLAAEARAAVARYDALLSRLENPTLMLAPLATQEAVFSSRIEGTQATFEEVLEFDAGESASGDKQRDYQEIVNYRTAMRQASEYLAEMPINLWLVRQMHQTLLSSARGQNKAPGKFRDQQNWIGPPGSRRIEDAAYIPPDPTQLPGLLENWEQYLTFADREPLIQTGIMHAQFEIIHPFLDGNGRIGRLLIPLYLFQRRLLSSPTFYLSEYLEGNREVYYRALRAISDYQDWDAWIEFFLIGVAIQAVRNQATLTKIERLRDETTEVVSSLVRSSRVTRIVQALFTQPLFEAKDYARRTGVAKQTASHNLQQLKKAGIVSVSREAKGSRPERLVFSALIDIVSSRELDLSRGSEIA